MAEHAAGAQASPMYAYHTIKCPFTILSVARQAARARKEQARLDRIAAEETEREEVCRL